MQTEFDRDVLLFGDGLVGNPEAIGIYRKVQANAIRRTLDPRFSGVTPIDF